MKRVLLITCLVACTQAFGADWYAAPNATVSGTGSISNPWPLDLALAKTASIRPGDTLYLRAGTYLGPGFVSTLSGTASSYVTVRSYPGERVIITDGAYWTLRTPLPVGSPGSRVDGVVLEGSDSF